MRIKILTILFLTIISQSFAQSQLRDEERERNRIKANKIQKATQWTYKFSKGKPSATGYINSETKYDKNGNPTEILNYKSTGQISSKLFYKYDQNNLKIEFTQFQKVNKPDLEVSFKQSFTYDESGNKKQEDGFDGATNYKIVYTYLPTKKPKDVAKFNADNFVTEKWDYSYNENQVIINIYKQGNKLDRKVSRKLDQNGNILEEINTSAAGKELQKTINEYDASGKLMTMKEFYGGNPTKTLNYKYNPQNQIIEILQTNPDGSKLLNHSYKYDGKGLLIEEKWFDGVVDDFSSKQYKYDTKSNVTEIESYYSDYKYKVLYKFTYEFY